MVENRERSVEVATSRVGLRAQCSPCASNRVLPANCTLDRAHCHMLDSRIRGRVLASSPFSCNSDVCVQDLCSCIFPEINTRDLDFTLRLPIPQTGLAPMGFSRCCPSSLDLTNFVVRRCRGGAAEVSRRCRGRCAGRPKSGRGLAQEFGNLETWKSRELGFNKSKK